MPVFTVGQHFEFCIKYHGQKIFKCRNALKTSVIQVCKLVSVTAHYSMMTKHRPFRLDRHSMIKHPSARPPPRPPPCPLPNCTQWPLANKNCHASHIALVLPYRIPMHLLMSSFFGMFEARELRCGSENEVSVASRVKICSATGKARLRMYGLGIA